MSRSLWWANSAFRVRLCILPTARPKVRGRLTINFGVLELPCRNLVVEEQVDLAKGAVFGLGKAEPAPYVAEEVSTSVEETSFGSPVPG